MAQELAITKAALSASLFRADPTSLSRPTVEAFFPLLSSTLTQCSRPNVQKCKAWIVDNVVPSRARTAALGRYLAALSKSLGDENGQKPSARRRRLHLLYVVNDVAHHVVARLHNGEFEDAWRDYLPGLVACAADFDNCPKHMKKLASLVDLWEENGYFAPQLVAQLRAALIDGAAPAQPAAKAEPSTTSVKLTKDAPYVLPSFHGDPATPWYDLPASTWLPHIVPNSTKPMMPDLIRPIQLAPGPADKKLVAAVQGLLSDVEHLFSKERKPEEEPHADLNELGERVVLDEVTGGAIGGETYYGWSRTFCEKMKERRKKSAHDRGRSRSRSRSRDYSRGRSRSSSGPPAHKRLRRSPGSMSPRRDSRSRSHSRSRSRSRSHSPDQRHGRPYRRRSYSRSPSRSRSRSNVRQRGSSEPHPQQKTPAPPQSHPPFPIPPPGELPPPPPPPAGYQNSFPPPPPPPPGPLPMGGGPQNWFPPNPHMIPPNMMGRGWGNGPPPPPPPPPGGHHHQGNHFGRSNGWFRGRGRGAYGRGRGR